MKYLFYILGIGYFIYVLVTFKKSEGNSEYDGYVNSKYYRLIIFAVLGSIAAVIALVGQLLK